MFILIVYELNLKSQQQFLSKTHSYEFGWNLREQWFKQNINHIMSIFAIPLFHLLIDFTKTLTVLRTMVLWVATRFWFKSEKVDWEFRSNKDHVSQWKCCTKILCRIYVYWQCLVKSLLIFNGSIMIKNGYEWFRFALKMALSSAYTRTA